MDILPMPSDPNPPQASLQLQKMYLRDVTFEQPNSPQIFSSTDTPQIQVNTNTFTTLIEDGIYEVSIKVSINATIEKKILFFAELEQAGLFEIRNLPLDQLAPNLAINCTELVYASIRENMADLIQRTGFPPVVLQDIDFLANYEKSLANQVAARTQAST
jgi:preprotein translocase subunit SecB